MKNKKTRGNTKEIEVAALAVGKVALFLVCFRPRLESYQGWQEALCSKVHHFIHSI